VAPDRQKTSLDGFWSTLSAEQLQAIEAVAIDMWEPYESSIREHVACAEEKIVYDKFHVAKHLGEAVDRVRRAENKELRAAGDERLVGTKYQWLRNPDNFTDQQWRDFRALRESNLKTARAWALKEQAMALWDYCHPGTARKHFAWWYRWATHSRLKPMIEKGMARTESFATEVTPARPPRNSESKCPGVALYPVKSHRASRLPISPVRLSFLPDGL
jgi:transposase